jgi:hypothetical protein
MTPMDPSNTQETPTWADRAALTIEDAAPILGDTVAELASKVERKTVPSVKVGGRRRIPVSYLLAVRNGKAA